MRTSKFVAVPALLWMVLLFAGATAPCGAEETKSPKTVRVLAIGNSFTKNATHDLKNLTEAAGHKLIFRMLFVSGSPLSVHANLAEQHETDPKRGLYKTISLKQALAAVPWDFVTIQQGSSQSHDAASYRPYAGKLQKLIEKHAPKTELVIHQTWAYRVDSPRFRRPPKDFPRSRQEMHDALTRAYHTIAGELGARVIPVGDAFDLAENDAKWGYKPDGKFDFAAAKPPLLPDQTHSLHVGYFWKNLQGGTPTISSDTAHAGIAGKYLAACVWFEFLFDESCVGNSHVPKEIAPEYARFLQETAHKAVLQAKEKSKRNPGTTKE